MMSDGGDMPDHGQLRASYKRPFDIAAVVLMGILFLPIWVPACIGVCLAILLVDGRPLFVVQERVGQRGRVFRMFKFRTMPVDTERDIGPVLPVRNDPRATRLGSLLRKTSLDESPQVVNILRGEMSLVGPRPERPEMVRHIKTIVPDYDMRLRVPPGIAGLDHVRGNYNFRNRLRYDNFYIDRASPRLDLVIIVWSLWAIVSRLRSRRRSE